MVAKHGLGRLGSEVKILAPSDMENLNVMRTGEVVEGFQRRLRPSKVKAIRADLQRGIGVWPFVLLGRLPEGELVVIDGQHRIEAHRLEGVELGAQVVDVELEEARELFLVHNSGATKVAVVDCYRASRNGLATKLKELGVKHDVPDRWLIQLVKGLQRGRPDFVDQTVDMNRQLHREARFMVRRWTDYKYWDHEDQDMRATYRDVRMALTLGHVHRLGGREAVNSVIDFLHSGTTQQQAQRWKKRGTIHRRLLERRAGKQLAQLLIAEAACRR